MRVADALVWALRQWDVRALFGVSGANIEHLHDAVVRLGDPALRSVLAKSEVGAAFMADGRARTHRTLGVCCATSGGGMMNLAVGLAESRACGVPVLAIVGQPPRALAGRGAFQDSSGLGRTVDALALFGAMTKYVAKVDDPVTFWRILATAVRSALSAVQGPACLLIPRDVFELDVGNAPADFPTTLGELAAPLPLDINAVASLCDALRVAQRPVILAGPEVAGAPAQTLLRKFADEACIPVATTMAAPGSFPNDSPLYLGCVGAAGHPSTHQFINERADLVVSLGSDLGVMVRGPVVRGLERAILYVAGEDVAASRTAYPSASHVEGACVDILEELRRDHCESPAQHVYVREPLYRYTPQLEKPLPEHARHSVLLQSAAITLLEGWLPKQGSVVFDAGNCAAAAVHGMRLPRGCTGTIALGMGGMGYAIAAAIGAQLDAPRGYRTLVLCGDGSFLMLGMEIHTAVELALSILFVVFNNGKHGMCNTRQQLFFAGRTDCTTYAPIDSAMIARGLGNSERLWSRRVASPEALAAALHDYHCGVPRPGVLDMVLPYEETPPFAQFVRHNAPTYRVPDAYIPGRLEDAA